jgi:ubiquinone/menaquinone biosynthesis C-methylase UbiE
MLPAGAGFHEGIAVRWAQGYASGSFSRRRICFLRILDRNVASGRSWLDLGCGSGVLTKDLLDRGADVIAFDGSPAMIKEAKALVGGADGSALTWIQGDVECFPQIADRSLDGVLCSSVIEYVERPDRLLSEVERVLRPGGKVILSIPPALSAVRSLQKAIRKLAQYAGQDAFSYLAVSRFEMEPNAVGQWLQKAGFVLDRITSFDPILPVSLQRVLRPALLVLEAHKSGG